MENHVCKECEYYCAHYVRLAKKQWQQLDHGHCVYPQIKQRQAQTPACKYFEFHPPGKKRKSRT